MWIKLRKGVWQQQTVAEHTVVIYQPVKPVSSQVILYLHDLDGKACNHFNGMKELIEGSERIVVCPMTGPTWWLNRVIPEFDQVHSPEAWLLGPVIQWIEQTWLGSRLALFGIGMGGQGALRLGFQHALQFPVVVGIQASIEMDRLYGQGTVLDQVFASPEQCRQQTAGMLLNPRQAPPSLAILTHRQDALWFRGNDRLHEKLKAMGVPHHADLSGDGSPAWWESQLCFAFQFMKNGLQAEARRLL